MSQDVTTAATPSRFSRLRDALLAPRDIAVLAFFRMGFGFIIAMQGARYVLNDFAGQFDRSAYYFTYWPFDFVKPFPRPGLIAVFGAMWLAGVLVAVGFYYRAAAVVLFLTVTYTFLLDASNYLNHEYLVCLLAFLMIFLPAHRFWSVDARLRPSLRTDTTAAWTIWLLRFQVGLVYFFAGIAKFSSDWRRGTWFPQDLAANKDFPLIGRFFTNDGVVDFIIHGALLLDLTVAFFLLHRRTRVFAYAAALAFHLMNTRIFNIGIFPWTMIVGTAIFFPARWPRNVVADLRGWRDPARCVAFVVGAVLVGFASAVLPKVFNLVHLVLGGLGGGLTGYFLVERFSSRPMEGDEAEPTGDAQSSPARPSPTPRFLLPALAAWVAFQLLMPLRHFVIPGDVHWTEEGQKFAWLMLLDHRAGEITYRVTLPEENRTVTVDPDDHLLPHQAEEVAHDPDMILQFAHHLRDQAKAEGYRDPEVRADCFASTNLRPMRRLVDPNVDLAEVRRPWFGHAHWLLDER